MGRMTRKSSRNFERVLIQMYWTSWRQYHGLIFIAAPRRPSTLFRTLPISRPVNETGHRSVRTTLLVVDLAEPVFVNAQSAGIHAVCQTNYLAMGSQPGSECWV